ncbi:MAG: Mu tail sheath family protein [Rhodocyclales bacterium]|nr:Mu tail sheath family protein [Rhodocyclales bacterium]
MPSLNISFDSLPSSIRRPGKYFEFNTKLAVRTLASNLQRVLIVGQRIAAGSVPALTIKDVFSDAEAANYFGAGSIAHLMVRAAITANPYIALQVIAMDDAGAGVVATGTHTTTGTATGSGVSTVNVGDMQVAVAVATGDTPTVQAAALKAQFDKQTDLPVTATVAAGVLTVTAKNKGTLGNGIKISATNTAPGSTVAVVAMASGASDPTIATALATVLAGGHNIIISAWNDSTNLTALRTHLDFVSGPREKRRAIAAYGHVGTLSQATTLAGTINSGRMTCGNLPGAYENVFELAASYGAVIASEEDPARPLNTLPLTGISAPPLANRLSGTEIENALANGVTPLTVGSGDKVQIERAVSTYTVDANGTPDISLLDLTTIRSMDYGAKAYETRIALRFPREKKTKRNKARVLEELLDVSYKLEELEIIENVAANAPGHLVEDDLQDPSRLDCKVPFDVVNGMHVVAGRLDLYL